MTKILVPVDFSDASASALTYGIEVFGASDLKVTVLHVFGAKSTALLMKNIDGVLKKDSMRRMDKFLKPFKENYPEVTFEPKIAKNYAVSRIVAMGDSGEYDFVVMGTKGASGLKEVFLGSVAGGVITKTNAAVIVVPDGHTFTNLQKIIFAVSDYPYSNVKVVEPLRKIAMQHKAELHVVHISEKDDPDIENELADLKDLNLSIHYVRGTGDTYEDLNEYIMKDQVGLVCLVRSKKGFMERLFNESVTLQQTFHSPVPLLILHD